MRIILAGGGTGGHLYPGLAIVDELRRLISCLVLFVGTKQGLEAKVVPEKGYRFRTVWISGLRRGRLLGNLLFPVKVFFSLIQALIIISGFRPDVVVGTGGYVSWPVLTAGIILGKRTVIHEQNQTPGLVTKLLAPLVDSVHLSFESSVNYFRKKFNLRISGNPTLRDLDTGSREEGYRRFGLKSNMITVFIFGGSQGSRSINQAVTQFLGRLVEKKNIQVLWATGPRWIEKIREDIEGFGNYVKVVSYINDMRLAYKTSDLLICRSGAMTVAEVTRLGLPAVFIPFPEAAGGHQESNAQILRQAGAAEIVLEDQIPEGKLEKVVFALLDDPDRRQQMGRIAKRFGNPGAAKIIAEDIVRVTGGVGQQSNYNNH